MTEKKYKLRRAVGVPVDVVVQELQRHRATYGAVRPQAVVDDAEPEDAPLHPVFQWDEAKAANEFRLIQARNLVRAVHVVDDTGDDQGCAFVHVAKISDDRDEEEDERGGYLPIAEVVESPDLYAMAMTGLVQKLAEAQRSVEDLQRAAGDDKKRARRAERAGKKISEARTILAAE